MTLSDSSTAIEPACLPSLRFSFRIDAEVAENIPLDARSTGELGFIPITGGTVTGALSGTVTPGGDWCLQKDEDTYRVEARYGILLQGGAYIDVHNIGILCSRPARSGGQAAEYFVTTPVFRTADPELEWLNRAVFVGHARELEGITRIDVFEVVLSTPVGD